MIQKERTILAIDLKSFYASVECLDRGLDPFNTPLVVCDKSRGKGTIILAVTPYVKTLGIPSRLRRYELPDVKNMIYATPRMERYIKKSCEVLGIYLEFVDKMDMHIYSIDEAFLDITDYLRNAQKTAEEFAQTIAQRVYFKTGLTVTIGIGSNLILAKLAMDIEAKHNKTLMAKWTQDDLPIKLWPISPLTKMWGIGKRMQEKLNALGMYTIGDIAISNPEYLKEKFGIIGLQIWEHTNGIDDSRIQQPYVSQSHSISVGQTLFTSYDPIDAQLIIRENLDELIVRLHQNKSLAGSVGLGIRYASGNGFSKFMRLAQPTDNLKIMRMAIIQLFERHYHSQNGIKAVSIWAGNLETKKYQQESLFTDYQSEVLQEKMDQAIENIKRMYGRNSLYRASALLKKSNFISRNNQIGGHRR